MAIPRPVLLALIGLALCGAAFVATRGAGGSSSTGSATPATVTPSNPPAAKPAAKAVKHAVAKPAKPAAVAPAHKAAAPAQKTAAKPHKAAKAPAAPTAAQREQEKALTVLNATKRGDVVVLLFTSPGAADDTATRQAVAALHGLKHVTVVSAGLDELTTFRPILQGAGVTQVPSVVVARAHQGARLIQGYVDANTLRQNVADALR